MSSERQGIGREGLGWRSVLISSGKLWLTYSPASELLMLEDRFRAPSSVGQIQLGQKLRIARVFTEAIKLQVGLEPLQTWIVLPVRAL